MFLRTTSELITNKICQISFLGIARFRNFMELPDRPTGILHVQDDRSDNSGVDFRTKHVENIKKVCSVLKENGIVAVPTDTIYGLAGLALSQKSTAKIYDIKNRSCVKPIAICVGEISDLKKWGKLTISSALLSELLPGPVTLIFERTLDLNPLLNPGTTLVGIRIPDNKFIRDICRECQEPLALTSANLSAAQSTLSVEEFRELWPKLDLVCDGGTISHTEQARLGSTVVDLSKPGLFTVIRPGSAYQQTIQKLIKYNLKEEKKN